MPVRHVSPNVFAFSKGVRLLRTVKERKYKFERLVFRNEGQKLIGSLLMPSDTESPLGVLILHGFPGVPPVMSDLASALCQDGFAPMMIHYRGCWGSGGRYSFLGSLGDARRALALLALRGVDARNLAVVGHSFGGLVAIHLAAYNNKVKAAVALCPVANLREDFPTRRTKMVLRRGLPFVAGLTMKKALQEWAVIAYRHDPINYVNRISPRPFLLIHGDEDDVIPVSCSRKLFSRALEPKEMVMVNEADHIFAGRQRLVTRKTVSWLRSALSLRQTHS